MRRSKIVRQKVFSSIPTIEKVHIEISTVLPRYMRVHCACKFFNKIQHFKISNYLLKQ